MTIGLGHYLAVAAILFTIGVFGIFLNRKNIIIILMSIELILLAVNINLVAFSTHLGDIVGQIYRADRADGGRGRSRHRARHPCRLLPQPRLHRGRRRQSDEGLTGRQCIRPSSSFLCSAPFWPADRARRRARPFSGRGAAAGQRRSDMPADTHSCDGRPCRRRRHPSFSCRADDHGQLNRLPPDRASPS